MINFPETLKAESLTETSSKFIIEPLYPGYGITIGNSLRRVLYSSLEGAAITKVKIKGVNHEFSTIPYVLEDVIAITLNLRQVRFKMFSQEPQKGVLKVKGEKEVKAGDIEFPSKQVEIVNKDFIIATITDKKGSLEMELTVEKGLGYKSADEIREEEGKRIEVGLIPVDAVFSPVRRVKYEVENVRFGKRTDYDKLIMEITTDGTILPQEALVKALSILKGQLEFIENELSLGKKEPSPKEEKNLKEEEVKSLKIEELSLPSRVVNVLSENKIRTVGGLLKKSKGALLNIEGLGEKGVEEIEKILKKFNLSLKE